MLAGLCDSAFLILAESSDLEDIFAFQEIGQESLQNLELVCAGDCLVDSIHQKREKVGVGEFVTLRDAALGKSDTNFRSGDERKISDNDEELDSGVGRNFKFKVLENFTIFIFNLVVQKSNLDSVVASVVLGMKEKSKNGDVST